jgi:hypothetical protein
MNLLLETPSILIDTMNLFNGILPLRKSGEF